LSLIVDSSVAVSWSMEDERSEMSDKALSSVVRFGAIVPIHWPIEVANALLMASRRSRMTTQHRDQLLANLQYLDITVDPHTNEYVWSSIMSISDAYNLTVYDATYLELAQRRRIPLATLDKKLRVAAKNAAVELYE